MGGSDNKENLVELTAREHFLCHWLLVRIYPKNQKLIHAFWFMCKCRSKGQEERYIPSSRTYQEAKELAIICIGNIHRGKTLSEEAKLKISKANTGRIHTQEMRDKVSKSSLGRVHTEETKNLIRNSNLGKTISQQTKDKMSRLAKIRKKKICIYCSFEASPSNIVRHHNENCKQK